MTKPRRTEIFHVRVTSPGSSCCHFRIQACVTQKTRKLYAPEKLFVKLRPAYSVKLVFSHVVKGIKIKIAAKFRDAEHLHFEDTKRIKSPEKLRDFRETGPRAQLF